MSALLAGISLSTVTAHAVDGTWIGTTTEWTDGTNWSSSPSVPDGVATFTNTGSTNVENTGAALIGQIDFTTAPVAQNYVFSINEIFGLTGLGVTNNAATQTFNIAATMVFQNAASAQTGTGVVNYTNAGFMYFQNTSTAGSATITNNSIAQFFDSSLAGSATLNNNLQMDFFDSASAQSSVINNGAAALLTFNINSTANFATINNATGGTVSFTGSSTADGSIVSNSGNINFSDNATAAGTEITNLTNGVVTFSGNSRAGGATIRNQADVIFNDTSTADGATIGNGLAGIVTFNNSSTAGSAFLNNSGTVNFNDNASGGTAQITNTSTGTVQFAGSSTAGNVTINNTVSGSQIFFVDQATAGNATINNTGGLVNFSNTSTAGGAIIDNSANGFVQFLQDANAGTANITNTANVIFGDNSSGANATIVNNFGGTTVFGMNPGDTATAGNANITNNNGGSTVFGGASTGGSATITTNNGGTTQFVNTSTGGNARFITNAGGFVDFSNSTGPGGLKQLTAGSIEGAGTYYIGAGNTLIVGGNNLSTEVSGVIADFCGCAPAGAGTLVKAGTGTMILSGANTYTGGTTITGGVLQLGNGGTTGTILGNVVNNATFAINRSDTFTFAGNISGSGSVHQAGTGTTILTGNNTYAGGTLLSAGTLRVMSDTAVGTGAVTFDGGTFQAGNNASFANGFIVNAPGGTIDVQNGFFLTLSGAVSGAGPLNKTGSGEVVLNGASTYTGTTTVNAGTFTLDPTAVFSGNIVNNALVNIFSADNSRITQVTTNSTGTTNIFGGTSVANMTLVTNGAAGAQFGTTNFAGNSTAAGATIVNNFNGLTNFNNTSTAGNASITNRDGFAQFNGNATAGNATITNSGTSASEFSGGTVIFQGTSTAGNATIVNNTLGLTLFRGNGSGGDATITTNDGGFVRFRENGTGGNARFITNAGGQFDMSPSTAASITAGSIEGAGAYFLGHSLLTVGSNNLSTEVSGVIADGGPDGGTGGALSKVGTGTLILSGANTYTGGTTILGGVLQLGNGGTTGSILGSITNNATLAFNRSDTVTFGGMISGTGAVQQNGSGTTVFTAANAYTGGTAINAGTLQLGNGGTSGSIIGDVTNNGTFAVNRSDTFTYGAIISGTGAFQQNGTGTTVFTAANTYTGPTTINAGILQLGNGGSTGSIVSDVVNNATFAINRSDQVTLPGVISGTGAFQQNGTGTTIFTGNNTYTGGTTINAGVLQLGNGGTSGSVAGNIVDNATLAFNRSDVFTVPGVISGTGAVQQNGSGTTIFTGANIYTGGTTINAGVLQLGSGGTTGSIVGDVANNAALAFNRSDAVTFGGVISGTGAVQQNGSGTTTLTGTNTYSGGTVINSGVLAVSTDANLGAAAGGLTFNGGVLRALAAFSAARAVLLNAGGGAIDTNGFNVNWSGVFSGAGGLTKTGSGVLALTADNTYTGTTTISAGTLQLGAGGTTGSLAGPIVNNSVLAINRSNALTLAGIISGTGALQQLGTGTTILTGDNTYTGGTTISAGTLQLGSGGTTGSVTGNIVDNSVLAINRSNTLTLAGVVSGTGALQQLGTGTTILTGNNTYTGGTSISAGILQLGAGGTSGSVAGNILDNAALAFNRSDTLTFGGVISGTGAVQQNGSGTTVLTAANTYTGPTTVNAGTLIVNGSIVSPTTVNAGGTAGGTGTFGSITVNGGTLSPGNSIGTLTVNGNLTFVGAGNYLVEVSPSAADRTNVTGTATLSGTVRATFGPGTYTPGMSYTILSAAGGRTGTFGALVQSGLPAFQASLDYTATDVRLTLANFNIAGVAGLNLNQQRTANAIQGAFNTIGTLPAAFFQLGSLPNGALQNALTQASGEIGTAAGTAGFQSMNQFLNLMLDPFLETRFADGSTQGRAFGFAPESAVQAALPNELLGYNSIVTKAPPMVAPDRRWTIWGAAFGGTGTFRGDAVIGSSNLDVRGGSFAAGIDYRFSPDTVFGVAVAGGTQTFSLDGVTASGRSDAVQGGIYGSTRAGNAYLSAAAAYARHDVSTERNVAFTGMFDRLTADYGADAFGGRIEGGYRFAAAGNLGITPYAAVQAQRFQTPNYVETDRTGLFAFALNYAGQSWNDTRTELGARGDYRMLMADGALLTLRGRAAWAHDFDTGRSINAAFQALPGFGFTVTGASPAVDAALVSAGAELKFRNGVAFRAKFDGEFAGRTSIYSGTGGLYVNW